MGFMNVPKHSAGYERKHMKFALLEMAMGNQQSVVSQIKDMCGHAFVLLCMIWLLPNLGALGRRTTLTLLEREASGGGGGRGRNLSKIVDERCYG